MKLNPFLVVGCCALLFAGCGKNKTADAAKPVRPAAVAVSNSDLAKGFLNALVPVSVSSIAPEQKSAPEFAAAMSVVEALTQLESMTGLKFYGRSSSLAQLAPELKAALTAKSTAVVPFFVEESRTGRIVFAPADAQQEIIQTWKKVFPRIAKRLDAEPAAAPAPAAPAAESKAAPAPVKAEPEKAAPAADPAQDIIF